MDQETKDNLIRLRENLMARIWDRNSDGKDFSELVPEFLERTEYLNKNYGTHLQIPPYVRKYLDSLEEKPVVPIKRELTGPVEEEPQKVVRPKEELPKVVPPVEELYQITIASDINNERMRLVIKYMTILGIREVSSEEVQVGSGTEIWKTYIYGGTPREITLLKRSIIALMDVLRVTNAGVFSRGSSSVG